MKLGMALHAFILTLRRQRQEEPYEFGVSLVYLVNSRQARAT